MAKKLKELLNQATCCLVAPCVYDCASARAVELVGFKAMMLSGGELSLAMNGVVDYGFTNLNDIEWMVSRISQTSPLPLAVDIEEYGTGFRINRMNAPYSVFKIGMEVNRFGYCLNRSQI